MHGYFFQAEDGIRYLVRSRGLGDVYKRQALYTPPVKPWELGVPEVDHRKESPRVKPMTGAKS